MRFILLLMAVMLLMAGAEARYSPGLEITQSENLTLQGGYLVAAKGITFNATAPTTTSGTLYGESGALLWDGVSISTPTAWDGLVKQTASGVYAYNKTGYIVASDTSSPYDIGAVFNALVIDLKGSNSDEEGLLSGDEGMSTIMMDVQGYTNSTLWLYPNMVVTSPGLSSVVTYDHIPIFKANQTDYWNSWIKIEKLELGYRGTTAPYDHGLVEIYNPQTVWMKDLGDIGLYCAYKSGNWQSLIFSANLSSSWLVFVEGCDCMTIHFDDVSDSYVRDNVIFGQAKVQHQIKLTDSSGSIHILDNHIICYPGAGIYTDNAVDPRMLDIRGNMFDGGGVNRGGSSAGTGILGEGSLPWYNAVISGNTFWGIEKYGIFLYNGIEQSVITSNTFVNCNIKDYQYDDIRIDARASGDSQKNTISQNTHYNAVASAHKAYPLQEWDGTYDPANNLYSTNTASGSGYLGGYVMAGSDIDYWDETNGNNIFV